MTMDKIKTAIIIMCLTTSILVKLKTNLILTKWDGLKTVFVIHSVFTMFKNVCGSANIILICFNISPKMGNIIKILSPEYLV